MTRNSTAAPDEARTDEAAASHDELLLRRFLSRDAETYAVFFGDSPRPAVAEGPDRPALVAFLKSLAAPPANR